MRETEREGGRQIDGQMEREKERGRENVCVRERNRNIELES